MSDREKTIARFETMYENALSVTGGYYKGYTGANALSLYVSEKKKVNAAADSLAHEALCNVISKIK